MYSYRRYIVTCRCVYVNVYTVIWDNIRSYSDSKKRSLFDINEQFEGIFDTARTKHRRGGLEQVPASPTLTLINTLNSHMCAQCSNTGVQQQRGATVAQKRQCLSHNRQQANGHANVKDHMPKDQCRCAKGKQLAKFISAALCNLQHSKDEPGKQQQDHDTSFKPPFLCPNGKYKVCLIFG